MKIKVFGQPGTKVSLDGQEYELMRIEFYKNAADEVREMAYWRSICAEQECREEFETYRPVGDVELTRRCPEHRKPGIRVSLVRSKRGQGGGRPRNFLRPPRAPEPEGP